MENAKTSSMLGSPTHAAKRAADIIFILENREQHSDLLLTTTLNDTLKIYGEQNLDITIANLDALVSVSRKLHAVFAAQTTDDAAHLLNKILNEHASAPRLSVHGGSPWHLHVDSNDHAPWAEWFVASSALALASLLAQKQRHPGGLCAASGCGRPFIDLGKGGGRHYCTSRCATRERVAAYRKR